jgi:hypothetical protein
LKRPSWDHDTGAARSLFGSDFDAEGLEGTGGGISWLLAADLVSFSSSLYSVNKRDYLSYGNCNSCTMLYLLLLYLRNFISKTTKILYQKLKTQST